MENKESYFLIFVKNKGRINEIELGAELGLSETETHYILAQLLTEHRIEYTPEGLSNYRLSRKQRKER